VPLQTVPTVHSCIDYLLSYIIGETVHNAYLTGDSRRAMMKIKYFTDTDTALIEFSEHVIAETQEVSENLYIDLDEKGNLVSMTIEHAKENANIGEVSFLQMEMSKA
jgi:uncharacterized protein YuzE